VSVSYVGVFGGDSGSIVSSMSYPVSVVVTRVIYCSSFPWLLDMGLIA